MSNVFGGGSNKQASEAQATARFREQQGSEAELRARQQAERGGGRGRDMLVGRLNKILPTRLGGV